MSKKYKIRKYKDWRPFIGVPEDLRMLDFLKKNIKAEVDIRETKDHIKLVYSFPKQ